MRFTVIIMAAVFFQGVILNGAEKKEVIEGNPYGVVAHLNRWEYEQMPQELVLMKQAGIGNVRTDLDWAQLEPEKGKWNFERWDALVGEAEKNNIAVLPILGGALPQCETPLLEHLDSWKNYLKTVLRHYPRISHWEVLNEPDLNPEFSKAEKYGPFLKETSREIKQINPDAMVMTGGFGSASSYLEQTLEAGGAEAVDIVNLHTYYWKSFPENALAADLKSVRERMAKYGMKDKKIWLTETGYATADAPDMKPLTAAALKKLNLDKDDIPVVLIRDMEYRYCTDRLNINRENFFSGNREFREISLKELKRLSPRRYPLLMLPPNESFPMIYARDLLNYVKKGGTLIFPGGGIPLYFNLVRQGNAVISEQAGEDIQKMFHIGWEAWWTNPLAPQCTWTQEIAPGFAKDIPFPSPAARFLSGRNLKDGDELIPIVTAYSEDRTYSAPAAAIYRFNSDLKGNIITFIWNEFAESVSRETQAKLLPRTILIALSAGVDKVFWYSFRSMGDIPAREHHFGIIERDLTPKPAYHAYKTLTEHCPPQSTRPVLSVKGGVYLASWSKPDGDKVYAVWRIQGSGNEKLSIRGTVKEIKDHLGNRLTSTGLPPVSDGILYFTGDSGLTVKCE